MLRTALSVGLLLSIAPLIASQTQNSPQPPPKISSDKGRVSVSAQQDKQRQSYTIVFAINQQTQGSANNMPLVNNQQTLEQATPDQTKKVEKEKPQIIYIKKEEGWGETVLPYVEMFLRLASKGKW